MAAEVFNGFMIARSHPLWGWTQALALGAVVALVAALVATPGPALDVLWNGLIPLVPALLLLHPGLWRNVCPLATVNMLTGTRRGRRILGARAATVGTSLGSVVLLAVLVPARRFLFNTDGTALAVTIVAVLGVALILGLTFEAKAGFCNAICPVLPVERLYGQAPLVETGNPRCQPCSLCTLRACIDLAPRKVVPQLLGPRRRSAAWLLTPFGAFAAAFPGFVVGYFTLGNVTLAEAASVYGHMGMAAVLSYLTVAGVVLLFRPAAAVALPLLAATAFGLYYWLAAPGIADTWHLGLEGRWALRGAATLLLVVWLPGALRPAH